jgi:hypothetical protein
VCLRVEDIDGAAWACQSSAQAAAGRLVLTLRAGDGTLRKAYALLPDTATEVRLRGPEGDQGRSPVDNVMGADAGTATAMAFIDAGGTTHDVPLP